MPATVFSDNLILAGLETLLYGIYLVLFFISMYFLVRRYATIHSWTNKPRTPLRSPVFSFSILLFLAVTGHWVTTAIRTFLGFLQLQENADLGAEFFNDPSHPTKVAQDWLLSVALVTGDGLIIHRLWVVWLGWVPIVVFPICCVVVLTIGTILSVVFLTHNANFFEDKWLTINTYIILANTIYCTGMIGWKIWGITRMPEISKKSISRQFLVIVVESAALYASWTVFFGVAFSLKSHVQLVAVEMTPTVIGIVNALIQTRVGLGLTTENTTISSLRFGGLSRRVRQSEPITDSAVDQEGGDASHPGLGRLYTENRNGSPGWGVPPP